MLLSLGSTNPNPQTLGCLLTWQREVYGLELSSKVLRWEFALNHSHEFPLTNGRGRQERLRRFWGISNPREVRRLNRLCWLVDRARSKDSVGDPWIRPANGVFPVGPWELQLYGCHLEFNPVRTTLDFWPLKLQNIGLQFSVARSGVSHNFSKSLLDASWMIRWLKAYHFPLLD